MLTLLALAALQESGKKFRETPPYDGLLGPKTLVIRTQTERMEHPKHSPKQGWEFDWNSAGFLTGFKSDPARMELRFRVFSQESTGGNLRAESTLRLLQRLDSYNLARLGLDHSTEFKKVVDVYLCYGGEPGGEQTFDADAEAGGSKVNTIYLYDLKSFTDPVEQTREVAHEYGHATLPPIGGEYTAPEAWANGYLGEKLYLSYLAGARTPVGKGGSALGPEDTFGATGAQLTAWVRKNVDPLVEDALLNGPRPDLLAGKGKASMDAFFGLALATARLYSPYVLRRALEGAGSDPKAFPEAAGVASAEPNLTSNYPKLFTLNIPPAMRGRAIWVPLGPDKRRNVVQGAAIVARRDGWARIRVGSGPVNVRNDPE